MSFSREVSVLMWMLASCCALAATGGSIAIYMDSHSSKIASGAGIQTPHDVMNESSGRPGRSYAKQSFFIHGRRLLAESFYEVAVAGLSLEHSPTPPETIRQTADSFPSYQTNLLSQSSALLYSSSQKDSSLGIGGKTLDLGQEARRIASTDDSGIQDVVTSSSNSDKIEKISDTTLDRATPLRPSFSMTVMSTTSGSPPSISSEALPVQRGSNVPDAAKHRLAEVEKTRSQEAGLEPQVSGVPKEAGPLTEIQDRGALERKPILRDGEFGVEGPVDMEGPADRHEVMEETRKLEKSQEHPDPYKPASVHPVSHLPEPVQHVDEAGQPPSLPQDANQHISGEPLAEAQRMILDLARKIIGPNFGTSSSTAPGSHPQLSGVPPIYEVPGETHEPDAGEPISEHSEERKTEEVGSNKKGGKKEERKPETGSTKPLAERVKKPELESTRNYGGVARNAMSKLHVRELHPPSCGLDTLWHAHGEAIELISYVCLAFKIPVGAGVHNQFMDLVYWLIAKSSALPLPHFSSKGNPVHLLT